MGDLVMQGTKSARALRFERDMTRLRVSVLKTAMEYENERMFESEVEDLLAICGHLYQLGMHNALRR